MSVLLIGGGIYFLVVLFALALVRVSSSSNEAAVDGVTARPGRAEFEQLVDLGSEGSHVAVQLETDADESGGMPGSRPGSKTRPRDGRKVTHRPQQSSGSESESVAQAIDAS